MNILGIILTVAFILWMPLSIWMLYSIYRSNERQTRLMQETLVTATKTASENAMRAVKTAEQMATLLTEEGGHTHQEEGDAPPPL